MCLYAYCSVATGLCQQNGAMQLQQLPGNLVLDRLVETSVAALHVPSVLFSL